MRQIDKLFMSFLGYSSSSFMCFFVFCVIKPDGIMYSFQVMIFGNDKELDHIPPSFVSTQQQKLRNHSPFFYGTTNDFTK